MGLFKHGEPVAAMDRLKILLKFNKVNSFKCFLSWGNSIIRRENNAL